MNGPHDPKNARAVFNLKYHCVRCQSIGTVLTAGVETRLVELIREAVALRDMTVPAN
jgi:hypothetical protein